jgi:hypothetical protein
MEYYKILKKYKLVLEQQTNNTQETNFFESLIGIVNNPSSVATMDTISQGKLKDVPLLGYVLNYLAPGASNSSLNDFLFGDFFSTIASSEITRLDPTMISRIPYLNKALSIYNTDKDNLGNNLILLLGFAALLYPKIQGPVNSVIKNIYSATPKFLQPVVGLLGFLLPIVLYTSPLIIYGYTFLDDIYYKDENGVERSLAEVLKEVLDWIQKKGEEFKTFLIDWYNENKTLKTKHSPEQNLLQYGWENLRNRPRTPAKYGGPDLMRGGLEGSSVAPQRSQRFTR